MAHRYFSFKKIAITLLAVFGLIQVIRIDTKNPDFDWKKDFITLNQPPEKIRTLLSNACYDCHSNATFYPWYSNIAPVSWWLKNHINEGREELNFSEWADYAAFEKNKKLKRISKEIAEAEMPLFSYSFIHRKAKLNDNERQMLVNYIDSLRGMHTK
jgi:hypothetical protein